MTAAVMHVEMSKTLKDNLFGSEIGMERPISDRRTVVADVGRSTLIPSLMQELSK